MEQGRGLGSVFNAGGGRMQVLGRVALESWYRGGRSPTFQREATRSNSLGKGGLGVGDGCTEKK